MTKNSGIAVFTGIAALFVFNAMRIRKPPKIMTRKRLPNNYNAMTVPPFGIFVDEKSAGNKNLIDHEMIHWRQYQQRGLIPFYVDYFMEQKKFGYDNMPMEIHARYNETESVKRNYTRAVRSGQAKTVYNPKFRL